eukprot:g8462.t1
MADLASIGSGTSSISKLRFTRRRRSLKCDAAALRSSDSPLSLKQSTLLRGREVEERALQSCVLRHESSPDGAFFDTSKWTGETMKEAYDRCAYVTSEYAKTFYLGTKLMTPEKAQATWAVYVWCRRTDELVDGPNASRITPDVLERWEERLEAIFEGRPIDILDAALSHAVANYPIDIQPFRDMIGGMNMDLEKDRYETFDELYEYCYRVASTVGLMTTPIMGIDPEYKGPTEKVYRAALALGTANQLTNILRDVGEDATERGRIYVPLNELKEFGISEKDVLRGMFARSSGAIDDRWKAFMKFQIARAREYFKEAEAGVNYLQKDARWPVWSALMIYSQILDNIEENNYNNFTQRAYVKHWKKLIALPLSFAQGFSQ